MTHEDAIYKIKQETDTFSKKNVKLLQYCDILYGLGY